MVVSPQQRLHPWQWLVQLPYSPWSCPLTTFSSSKMKPHLERHKISWKSKRMRRDNCLLSQKGIPGMILTIETTLDKKVCGFWSGLLRKGGLNAELIWVFFWWHQSSDSFFLSNFVYNVKNTRKIWIGWSYMLGHFMPKSVHLSRSAFTSIEMCKYSSFILLLGRVCFAIGSLSGKGLTPLHEMQSAYFRLYRQGK